MNTKILGAFAAVALLAACTNANNSDTKVEGNTGATGPGVELAAIGDKIFFDFNKSSIRADGRAVLDKQVALFNKYPTTSVQVAGNCDERGTEEYNLALGQRRADADAAYLKAKGIAASRITTISYGKDRPSAMGSNEQAWAQNRNATTTIR